MTDFDRARKVMVDNQLRTSGITDRRLLAAMGEVPRELFVPESRRELAYIDEALPVSETRKLGAPAPFAKLVQLAEIGHADHVLDLGCSTGYSAAVLGQLAASVVAVEPDASLAAVAREALAKSGAGNVTVVEGELETGGKGRGPYDVIVIEGAVESVPDALLSLLKPDGRLVALLASPGRVAVAHLFARSGKSIASRAAFDAKLPPLTVKQDENFVF
ncbi:MAG TPA: protein-L-isoaspartate O-methyltransferase [Devosia sp.]|jgi:protein-L-isoaspartate(D-aspartate) O-methyltransferase|nr:protein-L-isoaspartate O-methyltransferase [Devosia sp.]